MRFFSLKGKIRKTEPKLKPKAVYWLVLLMALTSSAQANTANGPLTLSSNDLINQSFFYDNKTVVYRGEVVGPVMVRGEHAWLNIYDGSYAIGVWCPAEYAKGVRFYGDYNSKGDFVEVTGVFHRTCREHGGDLDIHCDSLRVITPGHAVKHTVEKRRIYAAVFFGLIAFLLIIAEFTINVFKVVEKWIWDEVGVDLVQVVKKWCKKTFSRKK
jgi:hypothetical protein